MGATLGLLDASGAGLSLVGGKAASLGAMLQAGFAVPEGFVIASHAVEAELEQLEEEILKAFDALGSHKVAVRSSAVAEDSKEASWAGQLESFLNIERHKVLEHVRKCWDSVNSERAKSYARHNKLNNTSIAVVVQRMINSTVSGVAFSVHPVTNDKSHIIIEAGLGLGEAVVSGKITPDSYIVAKSGKTILQKIISQQATMLTSSGWVETGAAGILQKLKDAHIKKLANTVERLEKHWRHAVDVEWALEGSKLYITQCRPITTLSNVKLTPNGG